MSPIPEREPPIVNDETSPQAPTVAKAAVKSSPRVAGAGSCIKLLTAAGVVAVAGCGHVATGTKAGDCYDTPEREVLWRPYPKEFSLPANYPPDREKTWMPIPDEFTVHPDYPSTGEVCRGERVVSYAREQPCSVFEGPIVLRLMDAGPEERAWFGPDPKNESPLLYGRTHIFDAPGTIEDEIRGIRKVTGRMTALITEMKMQDGRKVSVCGVLYGYDGVEGIPILSPQYYHEPATVWGQAHVRFFWPPR
jgi:hypothetical protein